MRPPPPLAPGSSFAGRLVVDGLLAAHSTRAVYLARRGAEPVALSVWSPDIAPDAAARDRFVRDARRAGTVPSAFVPPVLDAGIDPSTRALWVTTEAFSGAPLSAVVAQHGPLDDSATYAVLEAVCDALGRAHAEGRAHLGLCADSVFLAETPAGSAVRVLDFGVADLAATRAATAVSHATDALLWMAPELAQPSAQAAPGPAADVWSLGLLAFYLLTGAHYWRAAYGDAADIRGVFAEVMFAPVEPARARASSYGIHGRLPPRFDAWFARCVARDVPERFADAAAAWAGLAAALTLPAAPTPAPPRPRPPTASAPPAPTPSPPTPAPPAPASSPPAPPARSSVPQPAARPSSPVVPAAAPGVAPAQGPRLALLGAAAIVLVGALAGVWLLRRSGSAPATSAPVAPPPTTDTRSAREALARSALLRVAPVAQLCGDGSGATAQVTATFDAQGSVSAAQVAAPLAETPVGECVVNAVREATLPPDARASAVTVSHAMPLR
jgi:serine/threonine protein kinase